VRLQTNFYAKILQWKKENMFPQLALQGQFQNEMKNREEKIVLWFRGENLWACKWDTPKRWHM
jgi:hypothetical protein